MSNDKIKARLLKRKLIPTVAIIIVIIIILTWISIWNNNEESNPLEFTIELVESPYDITNERPYDITNKNIYFQFKNINDKIFSFSDPEIGKSLDFIIEAKNGTEYHYTGPITLGPIVYKTLSPGEIENGTQMFGYHMNYSDYNYTNWQNSDTGEYWFFQPGTYKVYGKYESKPYQNYKNVLVGIWYSNTVTLSLE